MQNSSRNISLSFLIEQTKCWLCSLDAVVTCLSPRVILTSLQWFVQNDESIRKETLFCCKYCLNTSTVSLMSYYILELSVLHRNLLNRLMSCLFRIFSHLCVFRKFYFNICNIICFQQQNFQNHPIVSKCTESYKMHKVLPECSRARDFRIQLKHFCKG